MTTKILRCADVMGDCNKVIQGRTIEEVFAKAEEHVHKEHNMAIIVPSVMDRIDAAIKDKD